MAIKDISSSTAAELRARLVLGPAAGLFKVGQEAFISGWNSIGDLGEGWFTILNRGSIPESDHNIIVGGNYAAIRRNALTVAPYDYGIDFTNDPGFNPALTLGRASAGAGVVDYRGNVQILNTNEFGLAGGRRVENLFTNTATLATQTVVIVSGATAVISFSGTGTITFSDGATGTLVGTGVSDRVSVPKVATGSVTCTVSGSCTDAQFEIVEAGVTTPSEYVSNGVGGIRNLIPSYTEDFPNAAWTKTRSDVDTNGLMICTTTGALECNVTRTVTVASGALHTYAVRVRKGSSAWAWLYLATGANSQRAWFNLDTGTIGTNTAGGAGLAGVTHTMTLQDDGSYILELGGITTGTTLTIAHGISTNDAAVDVVKDTGIYLISSQVDAGVATEYQGIAAAGSPFVDPYHGWNADGVEWFSTDPYGTCLKTPGALGPDLILNGNFATDLAGWTATNCTATWVGGITQLVATATTNAYLSQPISIVKGRTYKVTARFKAKSGNTTPLSARAVLDNATAVAATNTILNDGIWETHVTDWVATATTTAATIRCAVLPIAGTTTIGDTAYFDSVSVKEVYAVPCTVLKCRPAITNQLKDSNDMTGAWWTKTRCTATAAGLITATATGTAPDLIQQANNDITSGSAWVFSAILEKSVGAGWVYLTFYTNTLTDGQRAWFDLANVVTGTNTVIGAGLGTAGTAIKNLGNGRLLCSVYGTSTGTSGGRLEIGISDADAVVDVTAGDAIYVYHTQLELGTVASDRVLTTAAAAATALAEDIQLYPDKMDYDQQGGTFALELQSDKSSAGEAGNQIALSAYTNASNYGQFANASGAVSHSVLTGGASQVSANGSTWEADTMFRIGWKLEANNVRLVKDGAAIVNDTAAVVPPVSDIYLGSRPGATNKFSGGFSKLRYNRPGTISDAQILTLTASALPPIGGI